MYIHIIYDTFMYVHCTYAVCIQYDIIIYYIVMRCSRLREGVGLVSRHVVTRRRGCEGLIECATTPEAHPWRYLYPPHSSSSSLAHTIRLNPSHFASGPKFMNEHDVLLCLS